VLGRPHRLRWHARCGDDDVWSTDDIEHVERIEAFIVATAKEVQTV
jgi:hypothetical protein